ncbi:MAG: 1-acyl-sn-glycerol-3-phosphate acyltransferase [Clostridia bacterium]|nr:1-acyl-sn-glycerol-3-phosphate acyltransferase [Clostridia bacterium]
MNRIVKLILKNIFKVPGIYIRLCRYAKNSGKYPETESWEYIQTKLQMLLPTGNIDLQVSGIENLPKKGGFMLYGNHQGMFDMVALCASCPLPLGVVYKQELKNIPVLEQILRITKSFALDRSNPRQGITVMQNVQQEIEKGRNYVIFPEGTRSKNSNTMGEWHSGSFKCASKTGCPIVPVAFVDCYKVLDQKGSKPVSAQLHYLEPIEYDEYKTLKTTEIAELVKSRVQQALDKYTV